MHVRAWDTEWKKWFLSFLYAASLWFWGEKSAWKRVESLTNKEMNNVFIITYTSQSFIFYLSGYESFQDNLQVTSTVIKKIVINSLSLPTVFLYTYTQNIGKYNTNWYTETPAPRDVEDISLPFTVAIQCHCPLATALHLIPFLQDWLLVWFNPSPYTHTRSNSYSPQFGFMLTPGSLQM